MTLLAFLILFFFLIFLTGLCVGSFLNVVISRAFSNESIVFPGSKCPKCQTPLKWYHNIPVLSYLILKGKCAFCEDKISLQYPVVELITGILFVLTFIKFGLGINTLFIWAFVSLFVVLAATDIREKVVFDVHTYVLVGIGLVYNFFNVGHLYFGDKIFSIASFSFGLNNSFIASLSGIILGILVMEIFARFGYLVAGTRAFGEGDTYIAAGLGAVFGWKYLITVLVYGFIIQIVLTIPVFVKKLLVNKDFRTLSALFVFALFVVIFKILDYSNLISNFAMYGVFSIMLIVSGFYLCKRILGGLKESSDFTYLPFGPAMVVGGVIMLFLL